MKTLAIEQCLAHYVAGTKVDRETERAAVKDVLGAVESKAPGKSVELRIPPYAAIQVVEGPNHRRGTPSAVVEMNARTLIELAVSLNTWEKAVQSGSILASGERSNLAHLFPC